MDTKIVYFGAGCFWHVQEEFDKLDLINTEVGYMGGDEEKFPNPGYKEVCSNDTGYIEVIKIRYNENKTFFNDLLKLFWKLHDPTSLNKQGADIGTQYKSVIFYTNNEQKESAENSKKELQEKLDKEIATEIIKAKTFFSAERYHQKYYKKNSISCKI